MTAADAPKLIRDILAAAAAVAAIVADRVFLACDENAAVPYVLVTLVSGGEFVQTQQGTDAWNTRAVEIASVAGDYATAAALAAAVREAIDGREDDTFSAIEIEGEYDAPQMDDATTLRARVQLYTAWLKN